MNQIGKATTSVCADCGETVLGFTVDVFSWVVYLEDHDLPVNADLKALTRQYRIWENRGPVIGWVPKYQPVRTWRALRATHLCAAKPNVPFYDAATHVRPDTRGGKQKHKHKERTT